MIIGGEYQPTDETYTPATSPVPTFVLYDGWDEIAQQLETLDQDTMTHLEESNEDVKISDADKNEECVMSEDDDCVLVSEDCGVINLTDSCSEDEDAALQPTGRKRQYNRAEQRCVRRRLDFSEM